MFLRHLVWFWSPLSTGHFADLVSRGKELVWRQIWETPHQASGDGYRNSVHRVDCSGWWGGTPMGRGYQVSWPWPSWAQSSKAWFRNVHWLNYTIFIYLPASDLPPHLKEGYFSVPLIWVWPMYVYWSCMCTALDLCWNKYPCPLWDFLPSSHGHEKNNAQGGHFTLGTVNPKRRVPSVWVETSRKSPGGSSHYF